MLLIKLDTIGEGASYKVQGKGLREERTSNQKTIPVISNQQLFGNRLHINSKFWLALII